MVEVQVRNGDPVDVRLLHTDVCELVFERTLERHRASWQGVLAGDDAEWQPEFPEQPPLRMLDEVARHEQLVGPSLLLREVEHADVVDQKRAAVEDVEAQRSGGLFDLYRDIRRGHVGLRATRRNENRQQGTRSQDSPRVSHCANSESAEKA
jgi:hypothetical protein